MLGELPDWVPYVQAARTLGCKPWELIEEWVPGSPVPTVWVSWALLYERVEIEARVQLRLQGEAQGASDIL